MYSVKKKKSIQLKLVNDAKNISELNRGLVNRFLYCLISEQTQIIKHSRILNVKKYRSMCCRINKIFNILKVNVNESSLPQNKK